MIVLRQWADDPWQVFYPPHNLTMVWSIKNRCITWVTWTRWCGVTGMFG